MTNKYQNDLNLNMANNMLNSTKSPKVGAGGQLKNI